MQKKLLLSLAVFATSTIVQAQDNSSLSLSYRVKEKSFDYSLGLGLGSGKYNTSSFDNTVPNDVTKKSFETSQTQWTNDFSYGISESFSVELGLDLSLENSLTQNAESFGSTVFRAGANVATATTFSANEMKNAGLEDFRLGSSYRYMNDSLKADLLVGLTISGKGKTAATEKNVAETAYLTSEGDAKSGGSALQLGTHLISTMGAFELGGLIGLNYKMEKKNTVVGGDKNTTAMLDVEQVTKSNMDLFIGFEGQYNFAPTFALGANLQANFAAKNELTYSTYSGGTTRYDVTSIDESYTDVIFGLNGKYLVASNVDLGLSYSHLFAGDIKGSVLAKPTSGTTLNYTTATTDRKDDRFGLDLTVRF